MGRLLFMSLSTLAAPEVSDGLENNLVLFDKFGPPIVFFSLSGLFSHVCVSFFAVFGGNFGLKKTWIFYRRLRRRF